MLKKMKKIIILVVTLVAILGLNNFVFADGRLNMSYLFQGTMKDYKTYIDKTQGSLDIVLPNLFNIKSDGRIEITKVIDKQFVEDMHKKGIKVIPYISNHWDREIGRKALSNYVAYSNEVVRIINEYNLDGINIDIENLTEDDKANFVQFTQYLDSIMPEGKVLQMAVAANPNDLKTGWPGSYDFLELDKYVDAFVVMTYDQSYPGSKAGPVAGYEFVEKSIKTMLKYTSPQKIILGIPFYGRYWNYDESKGGDAVILKSIDSIKSAFNATEYYDSYQKTPYLKFSVGKIGSTYSFSGKKFSVGDYIMYYENEKSIKEKLILVEKYNLKGSSSWALSQEDTSIWDNYKNWLNGNYYKDTRDSWAKNEIKEVTAKGYMTGADIHRFKPGNYMTREEFAAVICRVFGYSNVVVNKSVYNDVKSSNWAYDYINTLYSYGIMKGSGSYFNPKDFITREEVATVLYRALDGYNVNPQKTFYDVTEDMWSKKYIDFCISNGVLSGYPDGSFKPYNQITRAEIAKIASNIK